MLNEKKVCWSVLNGGRREHGFPHFEIIRSNNIKDDNKPCYFIPKTPKIISPSDVPVILELEYFKNGIIHKNEIKEILKKLNSVITLPDGKKYIYLKCLQEQWNIDNKENPSGVFFDKNGQY